MYNENWNDFENYSKKDVAFWISILENEYSNSIYDKSKTESDFLKDFLVKRLQNEEKIKSISLNNSEISFDQFQKINPLNNNLINVSKSEFKFLQTEYYLETEKHFVLFNWFTSA